VIQNDCGQVRQPCTKIYVATVWIKAGIFLDFGIRIVIHRSRCIDHW
jgi:hypothetical protein